MYYLSGTLRPGWTAPGTAVQGREEAIVNEGGVVLARGAQRPVGIRRRAEVARTPSCRAGFGRRSVELVIMNPEFPDFMLSEIME